MTAWLMTGLCSWLVTSAPRAETTGGYERFLLGESGTIPGWLVTAVNRETASLEGEAHPRNGPGDTSVLWVAKDGWLGLEPFFKPRTSGMNIVNATARLSLTAPLNGWLLLRVPGTLLVSIDRKPALHREAPLAQARGWQAVPLRLEAGVHAIELTSRFQRESWGLTAEVIDESGRAPAGAQWWVPFRAAPANKSADPFEVTLQLIDEAPFGLGLELSARNGTRVTKPAPVTVAIKSRKTQFARTLGAAEWPSAASPVSSQHLNIGTIGELLQLVDTDDVWAVDVRVGADHVSREVQLSSSALLAWQASITALAAPSTQPRQALDVSRASLQSAQRELSLALVENRASREVQRLTERVTRLADALTRHTSPWAMPGIHQLAWRASADSSLQRFALHVPASIDDGRPRPLVVVLHGYNGNGKRALEAFLDTTLEATSPKVDGYVLAPDAHGNAFYRGPGERDVLEILDWAVQALAVDKTRVSITGASMGGTGTAELAFHYPDRFAALSPLCGYQSYFVRRDIALQPLRQWERRLMHRFSPASSAESGRYLPMYLAQGLKDKPLENSRVLTNRYKQLGYSLVEDWPDLGHAVWKRTWAHAGLFPWLSQKQRAEDPSRVTLAITALRHASSHWLSVTELEPQLELARIDAEWRSTNVLAVITKGVRGFAIGSTSRFNASEPVQVQIDGAQLSLPAHSPLRFYLESGKWIQGEPEKTPLRKSVHVEGPWPDLWNEKLAFVYGTLDAATVGTNSSVARALAAPVSGVDYQYPVLSDEEYIRAKRFDSIPILVGTPADHRLLSKWGKKLPIVVEKGAVILGNRRYEADRVGAVFVYPNPENPASLVGIVTAPTPAGLWQSTLLPVLLPDFTVFDARTAAAAGQPILGRAGRVLAAGFFNADWSLPERINDPLDEK
jgi:poly(3-hydroxybutyrate) depolymerase